MITNDLHNNQFLVLGSLNAAPYWERNYNSTHFGYTPSTYYRGNDVCTCLEIRSCPIRQGFYCRTRLCRNVPETLQMPIPGLLLGCFIIDTFKLSSLECFYDAECISMVIQYRSYGFYGFLPLDPQSIPEPLALTRFERFLPNTTLDTVMSNLFVEDWGIYINFSAYYQQCAPEYCSYTTAERYSSLILLTVVISLISGISTFLRITILPITRIFWFVFKRSTHIGESHKK